MNCSIRKFFTDRAWREDKVAAYASVGLLVFLTSFFWAPTRDFMHVVYGLAFFAPVLLVLLLRRPDFNQYGGWFTGLALLYAGYASLSTLWSDAPRLEFFAQHFLFLAVWLAGTAWLASRGQLHIERLYRVLIIAGAIASICYQIVFHAINYPLGYAGELGSRLGFSSLGATRNPNTIGLIFGTTTLISYTLWLKSVDAKSASIRFVILIANAAAVLASQSRGAIVCMVVSLLVGLILWSGPTRKLMSHVVIIASILIVSVISIEHNKLISVIKERVYSEVYRPIIWKTAVTESFSKRPIVGKGLTKTTRINLVGLNPANHAHNAFIDAFYWTGLIGLLLMSAHMIYILRHWSCSPRVLPLYLWFLFGCLTALVDRPGFFEHLTPHWFVYWIPAGLIGALVMAERQKSSSA